MRRTGKKFLTIAAICGAGTVFQSGLVPSSCMQYFGQSILTLVDFCSIFNCTPGTFANLCEPVPLFVDCPNYQP